MGEIMAKKQEYNDASIEKLVGPDQVRKRPSVIFGSNDIAGCQHGAFEIIANSVDEARAGYGKEITVIRYLDHSLEVIDHGRGMPMDYNEKYDQYNWELLFCELYAGSKYKTNSGGAYETSLGTNGLGLCAVQFSSVYMDAEVFNNGFRYTMHFEKGFPKTELGKEPLTRRITGSRIHWLPDLEVFTEIDIPLSYFQETLETQAIVNDGVKFILKNETSRNKFEEYVYLYENGIKEYVEAFAGEDAFTGVQFWQTTRRGRDREDLPDYTVNINAALCFSNKKQLKKYYHNSSWLENGGSPEKAFKNAFVYQIDAYLKQNGKYSKSDQKIAIGDIEDCLILMVSSFSTETAYENQTKKAINNKFIQEAMTDFFKHQLEVYFIENKVEADKIANQILINMRSRVTAERTRTATKNNLIVKMDMTNRIEKFVDCRSKDKSMRELFIVEGDSALGACKQARDSSFQAIMPVRGKIRNCLKGSLESIFNDKLITDLIKILGCGVEVKTSSNKNISKFDLDRLNWDKIIICTDADVDGFHIRTLILTMFYRLTPTLIDEGKVYIAESPLYEITSKGETWFAYDEQEKNQALDEIGSAPYKIQRSKGLGENEPDMMWLTTMNPETRRLIKVTPGDWEQAGAVFDLLMGDDAKPRNAHITQEGYKYMDFIDVS